MRKRKYRKKYKKKKRIKQKKPKVIPTYKFKSKYNVMIFKNCEIHKYLKTYKSFDLAKQFIQKKYDEVKDIGFEIKIQNNRPVEYEIGLVEKNSRKNIQIFKADELGRNFPVLVENPDYKMIMLLPYKYEEKIQHVDSNTRLTVGEFIEKFLTTNSLKMISKLNNKIIVQDDSKLDLFALKNVDDCDRFINFLEESLLRKKKKNYMLVRDVSRAQRSYLYDELVKLGYHKPMLYKGHITRTRGTKTHSPKSQS